MSASSNTTVKFAKSTRACATREHSNPLRRLTTLSCTTALTVATTKTTAAAATRVVTTAAAAVTMMVPFPTFLPGGGGAVFAQAACLGGVGPVVAEDLPDPMDVTSAVAIDICHQPGVGVGNANARGINTVNWVSDNNNLTVSGTIIVNATQPNMATGDADANAHGIYAEIWSGMSNMLDFNGELTANAISGDNAGANVSATAYGIKTGK